MVRTCRDPREPSELIGTRFPGDVECERLESAPPADPDDQGTTTAPAADNPERPLATSADDAPFYGPLSECWNDGRPAGDTRELRCRVPHRSYERLAAYARHQGRPITHVLRRWLLPLIDALPDEREAA